MNVIVERLLLLKAAAKELEELALTRGSTLQGGDVAEAEEALLQISCSLDQVEEVIAMAAGKALPPMEPVPFEIASEEGRGA